MENKNENYTTPNIGQQTFEMSVQFCMYIFVMFAFFCPWLIKQPLKTKPKQTFYSRKQKHTSNLVIGQLRLCVALD